MVAILQEMERGFSRRGDSEGWGDLTAMLNVLRKVVASPGEEPRSIEAMRQAWWRWTTDSSSLSTPAVREFALIVRHAKNHGWLTELTQLSPMNLVNRVLAMLRTPSDARLREFHVAWDPVAQDTAEMLVKAVRARVRDSSSNIPDQYRLQVGMEAMLKAFVKESVRSLERPRIVGEGVVKPPLLQPREGWPDAFRALAVDIEKTLHKAAANVEAVEQHIREKEILAAQQRADQKSRSTRKKPVPSPFFPA